MREARALRGHADVGGIGVEHGSRRCRIGHALGVSPRHDACGRHDGRTAIDPLAASEVAPGSPSPHGGRARCTRAAVGCVDGDERVTAGRTLAVEHQRVAAAAVAAAAAAAAAAAVELAHFAAAGVT